MFDLSLPLLETLSVSPDDSELPREARDTNADISLPRQPPWRCLVIYTSCIKKKKKGPWNEELALKMANSAGK